MRILEISTYFHSGGGITTHVQGLADWLTEQGHLVVAAGFPDDNPVELLCEFMPLPLNRVAGEDGSDRVDPVPVRVYWLLRSAMQLRREIRQRGGFDVIHTHETTPLIVAWLATRGMGIPLLLTYHGASPDRLPGLVRVARRLADLVVSPSQTSLERMVSLGLPRTRTRQMGLGVRPAPAVDAAEVAAIRQKYLRDGTHLVVSLSRLDRQKGLDAMIRVARRARQQVPGLRILVGGRGPMQSELRAMAEREGVGDIITFAGQLEGAQKYLAAADLYLLTSRWEELPISIVEAFRSGLPVIATDCGGVRELVDDTVGRLCQTDDEQALAQALIEICQDSSLRSALARNAMARSAEDRFSPAAVNRGYEALYAEVSGAGPEASAKETKPSRHADPDRSDMP